MGETRCAIQQPNPVEVCLQICTVRRARFGRVVEGEHTVSDQGFDASSAFMLGKVVDSKDLGSDSRCKNVFWTVRCTCKLLGISINGCPIQKTYQMFRNLGTCFSVLQYTCVPRL